METGKKAVEAVKEATENVAASAKSGMEKTKATVQEKVDKMRAKDDYEKGIATEVKDQRITEAELNKQQAMSHNAAEKDAKTAAAGAHGTEAELHKQHAMTHDSAGRDAKAAVAQAGGTGGVYGSETRAATAGTTATEPQFSHSTTGATGHPTGAHQMSAMPGHGTGEPLGGHVTERTQVGSHPIGKATGTGTTTSQNRHVGGETEPGYT